MARPIGRPWYSTSMMVRSNGVNSRSMLRPMRAGSTSYRFPCRDTVANEVTLRCSRHRNARRSSAGWRTEGTYLLVPLAFPLQELTVFRLADRSGDVIGPDESLITEHSSCLL